MAHCLVLIMHYLFPAGQMRISGKYLLFLTVFRKLKATGYRILTKKNAYDALLCAKKKKKRFF